MGETMTPWDLAMDEIGSTGCECPDAMGDARLALAAALAGAERLRATLGDLRLACDLTDLADVDPTALERADAALAAGAGGGDVRGTLEAALAATGGDCMRCREPDEYNEHADGCPVPDQIEGVLVALATIPPPRRCGDEPASVPDVRGAGSGRL